MTGVKGPRFRGASLSRTARHWRGGLIIGSRIFEVKARADRFRCLYRWLREGDFGVIVAADRGEPLLVVRLGDFLRQCAFREPRLGRAAKNPDSVCGPGTVPKP